MKKILIIIFALMILAPSMIYADLVTFKVGYFLPRAKSDLWDVELENMDFSKSDFQASVFGFSYEYFLTRQISLIFGIDGFSRQKVGNYIDYISEEIDGEVFAFDYGEGFPISHLFSVSSTPVQVGVKIAPLGRASKLIPYLGGGIGLYVYSVRLQGEIIDFTDEVEFYDPNIDEYVFGYGVYQTDAREENQFAFGYHAFAGFMFPIGNRLSVDASFKMDFVKGDVSNSFPGFESFDLSGYIIAVGVNYWF